MREVMTNLWIGNAADARDARALHQNGVRAVIDLAREQTPAVLPRELIYCRIPLVDGWADSGESISIAIDTVAGLIRLKTPTLVACSIGVSRSPTIVAAALSKVTGDSFEESIARVADCGPCDISGSLLNSVQGVLDQRTD